MHVGSKPVLAGSIQTSIMAKPSNITCVQDDKSDPNLLAPNEPKSQSESDESLCTGPDEPTVALHEHETDAALGIFMCSAGEVRGMPERFKQVLSSSIENVEKSGQERQKRCKKSLGMQEVGDLEIGKLGAFLMIKLICVSNDGERFAESSGYSVRGVVVPRHLTRLVGYGEGPCAEAQKWLVSELEDPDSLVHELAAKEGLTTCNIVDGQRLQHSEAVSHLCVILGYLCVLLCT